MMDYEAIKNAIIEQAVKDYRWARAVLAKDAKNADAIDMSADTEQFFHSAWFALLTSLDGEWLLQKLEGEFA